MNCRLILVLALTASSLSSQLDERVVVIGTRPGLLRYDVESFVVTPGARVELTLVNYDDMMHNLLLCDAGSGVLDTVVKASMALGNEAMTMSFVPRSPLVLHHTTLVLPGQRQTLRFRAPDDEGAYPYVCTVPGHAATMRGVMRVSVEKPMLSELAYRVYQGSWQRLPVFDDLEPVASAALPSGVIDLAAVSNTSDFGVVFTAVLEVARAGEHRFYLNSDDGSRITVDGQMVVDYDGRHPPAHEQVGEVALEAGRHQLRIEFFQGGGGKALQVAWQPPDGERRALSVVPPEVSNSEQIAVVLDRPVVQRVFLEDAAERSIAVGLPGGSNFCFDAQRVCVAFAWRGAFLDLGPDRNGRGGRACPIQGERIDVGCIGFPLSFDGHAPQTVHFRGYRTSPNVAFSFDADGRTGHIVVVADPSGEGLRYSFHFDAPPGDVAFHIDRQRAEAKTDHGKWDGNALRLPTAAGQSFSVDVTPRRAR